MKLFTVLTVILALGFLALKFAQARGGAPLFFFGVSNAAFQVEGSPADSDWREWTRSSFPDGKPRISDMSDAEVATRFWSRYDEDFRIAQEAGMNAFRMSIAWERIEPAPGEWDEEALGHYEKMIVAMRRRGLEPFITLNHYVLPLWVSKEGGVTWADFPKRFGEYARHVAGRLGRQPAGVKYFMTLNEPTIVARFGYLDDRKFPPGINDATQASRALAGLAKAHIEACKQIRSLGLKQIKIGVAHNWQVFEPLDGNSASDVETAKKVDRLFNRAFIDAITTGNIDFSMPYGAKAAEKAGLPGGRSALDYLGIQNYGRSYVTAIAEKPGYAFSEGPGPKSDLGWELVPDALYTAVKQASSYGIPLIITETGLADRSDKYRARYLQWNFEAIRRLLSEKVRLFGYIHWSLTDNFEWAFGLTPRFGLVDIDYVTSERKPRASLSVYADLIRKFKFVT